MSKPISTREQLDTKLAEWDAEGFHGATCDGGEFAVYQGWPIEKYGTENDGRICRPSSYGHAPFVFRVEAEKCIQRYPGKIGRILDDCDMKYRSAQITEELAMELKKGNRP